MKLGLVADVHADANALRRALDWLDALGAEAVLCAGDLVDYGFWPDETISLIRARGILCVRGNHDRKLVARPPHKRKPRHSDPAAISLTNLDYLRALPVSHAGRYGGLRVVVYHAAPDDDEAWVHPAFCSPADMAAMLRKAGADVLISGHIHLPVCVETPAGLLINPGSLFVEQNAGRLTSRTFGLLDAATLDYRLFDVESGAEHTATSWPWWDT